MDSSAGQERAGEDRTPTIASVDTHFGNLYEMLRAIATRMMANEASDGVLQATAIVHEAYVRLVAGDPQRAMNRALFCHAAAEEMRRVVIDHVRARNAIKRGAGKRRHDVNNLLEILESPTCSIVLELDDAISALGTISADVASVVRLRFYAGLSVDQTAEVLGCSPRSVDRDWAYARAWLFDRLKETH